MNLHELRCFTVAALLGGFGLLGASWLAVHQRPAVLPPTYPQMTPDQALAELEELFDTPPAEGWEERLAAWEKTPEGQKALREWKEGR